MLKLQLEESEFIQVDHYKAHIRFSEKFVSNNSTIVHECTYMTFNFVNYGDPKTFIAKTIMTVGIAKVGFRVFLPSYLFGQSDISTMRIELC